MGDYLIYTTKAGDTFDSIALELYSDERLASSIIELNPQMADVLIFDANIELRAPIIEEDADTPGTAPPWRR